MPRTQTSFPTRRSSDLEGQERTEKEQSLNSQIAALRKAEEEQLKRVEEAQAQFRSQEEAHQRAEADAQLRAQQLEQRLAELRRSEEHTSELQSHSDLVCLEHKHLSLHDALPISKDKSAPKKSSH